MTRRATAFMLVWAYLACALWLPLEMAHVDQSLYLFPPGYFFAIGGLLALINEWLSKKCPRLWVVLSLLALSLELGIGTYGGHPLGISLGSIFAAATLCSSIIASRIIRFTRLLRFGNVLSGVLFLSWLIAPYARENYPCESQTSPSGAFIAYLCTNDHGEAHSIFVGPRYSINGSFGYKISDVQESFSLDIDELMAARYERGPRWVNENTLQITSKSYSRVNTSPPSLLLPIRLTYDNSVRPTNP